MAETSSVKPEETSIVEDEDFANKCDDCELGYDTTAEHFERLLRGGAVGKVVESEALKKHWRDYERISALGSPFCSACNTHFCGFVKFTQHVVRRTDFEEGKEVTKVEKVKVGFRGFKKKGPDVADDDEEIPKDSADHREVFDLLLEFITGIGDDTKSRENQQELLTQMLCARSNPVWDRLQLKNSDPDGVPSDEVKIERKDDGRSDAASKEKAHFRCLVQGCNKEFNNLSEHLAEIMFVTVHNPKNNKANQIQVQSQQEVRANHWKLLLKGTESSAFDGLSSGQFVTMCPVCGSHFRGNHKFPLNALMMHLNAARRYLDQRKSMGKTDKPRLAKNRVDRLTYGAEDTLDRHGELADWLIRVAVDTLVGRISNQQLADDLAAKIVCDEGRFVHHLGEVGEVAAKNRIPIEKKKEEKDKEKVKVREAKFTTMKKSLTLKDRPLTVGLKRPADRAMLDAGKRTRRDAPPGLRGNSGLLGGVPQRGAVGGRGAARRVPHGLATMGMNLHQRMGSIQQPHMPTFSAECSLCTTSFPARSQVEADRNLHQHLMDTLFGARIGRTGQQFPPHRYWHQVAPTSRRALCPKCHQECDNLDGLAQHLALAIDGSNMAMKQSHLQAAQLIADKFVDHMSGGLSVDGLRQFMARFGAPESRLGASFTGFPDSIGNGSAAGGMYSGGGGGGVGGGAGGGGLYSGGGMKDFGSGSASYKTGSPGLSMSSSAFSSSRGDTDYSKDEFSSGAGFLGAGSTQGGFRPSGAGGGGSWTPLPSTTSRY